MVLSGAGRLLSPYRIRFPRSAFLRETGEEGAGRGAADSLFRHRRVAEDETKRWRLDFRVSIASLLNYLQAT